MLMAKGNACRQPGVKSMANRMLFNWIADCSSVFMLALTREIAVQELSPERISLRFGLLVLKGGSAGAQVSARKLLVIYYDGWRDFWSRFLRSWLRGGGSGCPVSDQGTSR